ncbi:hypothetical protein T12_9360 [Trichinella patagoniensis]|uniref:DUF7047 domain-containing protein n=1 Tax=Trichinella patagoniensis TaxID=990121 RepID=A0A0V0Z5L8_9BILA|nr:hypothetical protein T12_9360 [Trichinella patagoniensis]
MPHTGRQRGPDPSEQDLSAVPHWQIPIALPDSSLQRQAILPNPHGILIERGTIAHESHTELLALPDAEVRKRISDYNDGILVNISVVSVDRRTPPLTEALGLQEKAMKLVRHLPVYGCLRVAAAYIKQKANEAKTNWDELMEGGELKALIEETALAVKKHDPARVRWDVSAEEDKVFVDASSECC